MNEIVDLMKYGNYSKHIVNPTIVQGLDQARDMGMNEMECLNLKQLEDRETSTCRPRAKYFAGDEMPVVVAGAHCGHPLGKVGCGRGQEHKGEKW